MAEIKTETLTIPYQQKTIDACINVATNNTDPKQSIILTHGAGGDMHLSQLVKLAESLAGQGFLVLRLRFTCKGLNLVYRTKVYMEVLRFVKEKYPFLNGCFIGGRSMGSRAAVAVANNVKGTDLAGFVLGVICISYPLHVKDNHTDLRSSPLLELSVPATFISGGNDNMCDKKLLKNVLESVLVNTAVEWIDDADHGLKGIPEEEVVDKITNFVTRWCKFFVCDTDNSRQPTADKNIPIRLRGRKGKSVSV